MGRAPWKNRHVTLAYSIGPRSSLFTITDEGEGFDTSKLPTQKDMVASLELSHGRGIFLSMHSADTVVYTAKGNEVAIEFSHNGKAERTIPEGFIQTEPRHLAPGDALWRRQRPPDAPHDAGG